MENKNRGGRPSSGVKKVQYKRNVPPELVEEMDHYLEDLLKYGLPQREGVVRTDVQVVVDPPEKLEVAKGVRAQPKAKIEGLTKAEAVKVFMGTPKDDLEPRHYSPVGGTYREPIRRPEDVAPVINQKKNLAEERRGAEPV